MDDKRALNRRYETMAWGVFFILLGVRYLVPGMPDGVGTFGVGVILLGLNAVRFLSGIPTSGFTLMLGVLALIFGGADLLRAVLSLQVDLPLFPLLLIVIGVVWLARSVNESRTNKRLNE